MRIILNKNRNFWGVDKTNDGKFFNELWLTRSKPGPIEVDLSAYPESVVVSIKRGLRNGAIVLCEEDKDQAIRINCVPQEKDLYLAASNILRMNRLVGDIKKAILSIPVENLLKLVKTKNNIYIASLLDILKKLEIEGKNRKTLLLFLDDYRKKINSTAYKHLKGIPAQVGYYYMIKNTEKKQTEVVLETGEKVLEESVVVDDKLEVAR